MEFPRRLAAAGAAEAASLRRYAIGHLVLWTTRTNVAVTNGLSVLTNEAVRRVAIANPATAPYGRAARAALTNAALWDAVQPKLVLGDNIAQTAQFVETGTVDAGLVGLALVSAPRLQGKGVWWPLPDGAHPPLEQGGILTARGATNAAARAFLDFLGTEKARAVLGRFGFRLPPE
jgi:molybdate transport system substrate-binding protein